MESGHQMTVNFNVADSDRSINVKVPTIAYISSPSSAPISPQSVMPSPTGHLLLFIKLNMVAYINVVIIYSYLIFQIIKYYVHNFREKLVKNKPYN